MRRWLGIALAWLLAACGPPQSLDPIEATMARDGTFRVLAGRVSYNDYTFADDYRFATAAGGTWAHEVVWDADGRSHWAPPPYWLLEVHERDVIVADLAGGNRVLLRGPDGVWSPIAIDSGVPDLARTALVSERIGGAWIGADGELRVLVDGWLFESSGESLARALPVEGTCHSNDDDGTGEDCRVVPDGDRSADGVVFDAARGSGALRLQRLECTDASCAWSPVPEHQLGMPGPWGSSTWERRLALRDAGGRLFVVHEMFGFGFGESPVRVAGAGREDEIPGAIYGVGAAARPSGGLVVVTSYYSEALWIHLIEDDPDDPTGLVRTYTRIGSTPIEGSLRLRVLVPPAADRASERAHVFLTASASRIVHLTVDLATASVVAQESIEI